ncbi:MAG: hypothetical protein ACTS73_05200 [Arsenophonus sp. NEOnobi-MAG3]
MEKSTRQVSTKPDITSNPLHELICNGARQLIVIAVELDEFEAMLNAGMLMAGGHAPAIVHNGYLPQRTIPTV